MYKNGNACIFLILFQFLYLIYSKETILWLLLNNLVSYIVYIRWSKLQIYNNKCTFSSRSSFDIYLCDLLHCFSSFGCKEIVWKILCMYFYLNILCYQEMISISYSFLCLIERRPKFSFFGHLNNLFQFFNKSNFSST